MGLDSIINVQISRQTQGVTQAGFGVPLILGPNGFPGEIRTYTSLDAMADDYEASDAEYVLASKLFAQTPHPEKIKVGNTTAPVAQVRTLTPTVDNEFEYVVEIDGVEYSFTSDMDASASEIVSGLAALINGDADCKVTASGSSTLILTADSAGRPFTVQATGLSIANTANNNGIAEDIQAAIDIDNDWYCLLTTAKDDTTLIMASETIEALKKIYIFDNSDADVITNVSNDIVSELKAKNLFRSAVMYLKTAADRASGGLSGRVLPLDPGSETWAYKTLASVTVDKFTDSEIGYLDAKNANYYINIGGVNVTQGGKTLGGEYLDIIRFIDWVTARMQEEMFGELARQDKIPFTDAGIAVFESCMRKVLDAGVRAGGIGSQQDYTVTVPKASTISANDKAIRRLTGLKFSFIAAGAIHKVAVQGTVTLS